MRCGPLTVRRGDGPPERLVVECSCGFGHVVGFHPAMSLLELEAALTVARSAHGAARSRVGAAPC